ncbi:MAG: hypothetical protein J0H34_22360 [Rhizobiales bacterium]|nr:hypothetical protein [Hyphomicrobiales bacterium]
MSVIAFSRAIGPVPISCVLSEKHESSIEISEIPIETGAKITDHAYVMPKKVSLDIADGNATATFAALVRFQESRAPFTLVTGLTVYRNMLIKSIDADRDAGHSLVLSAKVEVQEAIIVSTARAASSDGGSKGGEPGGAKSTKAPTPTKAGAGDTSTADRAAGTVAGGDASAVPATPKDQSFLRQMFGS